MVPADLSVGEDIAIEVRLELSFTFELTAIDDTAKKRTIYSERMQEII
jgi:hypothetical protein